MEFEIRDEVCAFDYRGKRLEIPGGIRWPRMLEVRIHDFHPSSCPDKQTNDDTIPPKLRTKNNNESEDEERDGIDRNTRTQRQRGKGKDRQRACVALRHQKPVRRSFLSKAVPTRASAALGDAKSTDWGSMPRFNFRLFALRLPLSPSETETTSHTMRQRQVTNLSAR